MDIQAQRDYLLQLCSRLSLESFGSMAGEGTIRTGDSQAPALKFGSSQTALSQGLSYGYSIEDIAHFYLRRSLPEDEREALDRGRLEPLPWVAHTGYSQLCEDVVYELGCLTTFQEMGLSLEEVWQMAERERYQEA